MGYALVWIELLAAGLLWIAAAVALSARLRTRWVQWLLAGFLVLVPIAAGAVFAVPAQMLGRWFAYVVSMTAVMALCGLALVWLGLRRNLVGEPAASGWPLGRLAIAWCLVAVLHVATMRNLDSALQAALASVRNEAGSMALAAAPPRVADYQNAALVYERAFEAMGDLKGLPQESLDFLGDPSAPFDADDKELREFLDPQQLGLALIRRAAAMPECRFERDYSRPTFETLLPEVQAMRNAARLLALDARVKTAEGDVSSALADVSAIFAVALHASGEPTLISFLVSAAIDAVACQTLEAVLATSEPTPDDLQALRIGEIVSFRMLLARSIAMEEAFGLSAFAAMSSPTNRGDDVSAYFTEQVLGPVSPAAAILLPYFRVFFLPHELDSYRSAMQQARNLTQQPHYLVQDSLKALDQSSENRQKRKPGNIGVLTSLLLPALNAAFEAAARAEARHQLALAAAAAARYKAAKGEQPADLDSLAPEFLRIPLVDPYDGKPLKVAAAGDGLIIYSIGPDGRDDGGAAFDAQKKTGDIPFHLGRPDSRAATPKDQRAR
ncbi:MAG: hypothetical protein WD278_20530 [Pirellulales bacterium]